MPRDYWLSEKMLAAGETREERPGGAIGSSASTIKIRVVLAYLEFDDGERVGGEYEVTLSGGWRAQQLSLLRKLVRAHDTGAPNGELFKSIKIEDYWAMQRVQLKAELDTLQSSGTDIATLLAKARRIVDDLRMTGCLRKEGQT